MSKEPKLYKIYYSFEDDIEIKITIKRYNELLKSEKILDALYAGGVDNWEWYEESLKELENE